jgi:hypothetical protein
MSSRRKVELVNQDPNEVGELERAGIHEGFHGGWVVLRSDGRNLLLRERRRSAVVPPVEGNNADAVGPCTRQDLR